MGRGVFAAKDINIGDEILRESPLVFGTARVCSVVKSACNRLTG